MGWLRSVIAHLTSYPKVIGSNPPLHVALNKSLNLVNTLFLHFAIHLIPPRPPFLVPLYSNFLFAGVVAQLVPKLCVHPSVFLYHLIRHSRIYYWRFV